MKKDHGFTLMELMVVIAIVAILSAIAVPNVFSSLQNRRFISSIQKTLSVLNSAKMRAVKENARTVVAFDTADQSFRAFVDRTMPPNNNWDSGTDQEIVIYKMPAGVSISSAAFANGTNWVRFNSLGMPNGTGGRVELTSKGGVSRSIVMNITGRISIN